MGVACVKMASELEDFEYQLRAEQSYAVAAPPVLAQSSASTYVDPSDGTVYEWDEKQRGWVPKVMLPPSPPHIPHSPSFGCCLLWGGPMTWLAPLL